MRGLSPPIQRKTLHFVDSECKTHEALCTYMYMYVCICICICIYLQGTYQEGCGLTIGAGFTVLRGGLLYQPVKLGGSVRVLQFAHLQSVRATSSSSKHLEPRQEGPRFMQAVQEKVAFDSHVQMFVYLWHCVII